MICVWKCGAHEEAAFTKRVHRRKNVSKSMPSVGLKVVKLLREVALLKGTALKESEPLPVKALTIVPSVHWSPC